MLRLPFRHAVQKRGPSNSGQQPFELKRSRDPVRVFLRDHFPLFRDAHAACEGTVRERFQKYVRRTGAPAHRSAAAVKKRQVRIMLFGDFS